MRRSMIKLIFIFVILSIDVPHVWSRQDGSQFNVNTHFRQEEKLPNGNIKGEYGFRTPDGCLHVVLYAIKNRSYRVTGRAVRDCFPVKTTHKPTTTTEPTTTTTTEPTTTTTTTESTTTTTESTTTTTTTEPTTTTTTNPPTTTTRQPKKKKKKVEQPRDNEIRGKQLIEDTGPPEEFLRPSILTPDDPEPEYSFGYQTPTHAHTQVGLPGGDKKGKYWYDTPDGWRIIVTYEADDRGFRPKVRQIKIPEPPVKRGRSDDDDGLPKQLNPGTVPVSPTGCPYYFYTNTRINYHWERCLLNGTRVGEYGKLGSDNYAHLVNYYADARGYRPKLSREVLTPEQQEIVAGFVSGAFIIPKIDEEKEETERRIREWIEANPDKLQTPLNLPPDGV